MIPAFRYRQGRLAFLILLALVSQISFAQNFPTVDTADEHCYDPEAPLPLSDFITLLGDDNAPLEGMQITISQNFDPSDDLLTYQNNNGVSGSFDAANGILTLTGNTTLQVYKEAIEQVFFSTTADVALAARTITISLSNLDYLPETGHFYQYVADMGILWNPARVAAEAQTLFGLQGYLATITSSEESAFLVERVSGSAWIGATDEASEGTWRWVTGPEGLENNGAGRVVSGFVNWNDDEPNNCCGGEDFAHMMDWTNPPGRWNDLNNNSAPVGSPYHPTGYMIEYGGMPGDPDVFLEITGSTVLEPLREVNIVGPVSLCPNITGVVYTAEDLPGYSYVWTVDGGTITAGQGDHEITVSWGDTNPNAKVSVRAVSDIACEIEAELQLVINVQLEPPLPSGPDLLCFTDLAVPQVYNTLASPGSNYDWKITGGQIFSGQGTNEIEVLWDGPGTGTLYFTESTTTATDICDGDSPLLTVELREAVIPTLSITNVSCFNGSDGTVSMTDVQGLAPISYDWNTDGQGLPVSNGVTDLPAGTYSVDVTAAGCTINYAFTITEPEELTGSLLAADALCFGTATGQAEAIVTGGTGEYRYVWSINRPSVAAISGLPKGTYSVDVFDENDCVLTLNFEIDEPPRLVIDDIASTLVSCPGGSDGTLEATVSGGTPPYTYAWSGSEDVTALAEGFSKGTFELIVTDANGCTVRGEQSVDEATPKFILPNAFTPNGDGENDTFGPSIVCPFRYSISIYNKWGGLVFVSGGSVGRWDGTINGVEAPAGRYSYRAFWSITVNDEEVSQEAVGTLRLFR